MITLCVALSATLSVGVSMLDAPQAYADDPATFATLYNPEEPTSWGAYIVGAVVVGVFVYATAGLASPFIAAGTTSIATSIGGAMGLSGAAATSAGLAFLGGGSLATGGFGMAGGAAVLTTLLTFSTEVAIDRSLDALTSESVDLSVASRGRVDLMYPVYKQGAGGLRRASELLEAKMNRGEVFDSPANRATLERALSILESASSSGTRERLQVLSARALISLILDDYEGALRVSMSALKLAKARGQLAPVAEYVFGVSSLHAEGASDQVDHFAFVRSALTKERRLSGRKALEGLAPLLLSVYADRLQLKAMREDMDPAIFDQLTSLALSLDLKMPARFMSLYPLATRRLIMLKRLQAKIVNLTQTQNPTLKSSPRTLEVAQRALDHYRTLSAGLGELLPPLEASTRGEESTSKARQARQAHNGYRSDLERLTGMIATFKASQERLAERESASGGAGGAEGADGLGDDVGAWLFGLAGVSALLLALIALSRRDEPDDQELSEPHLKLNAR